MPQDLPGWVAELTDPRRATTLDQLADRLVPLAEHSIDVSRRLQTQLGDLNEPFKREALYDRVERLKQRADEAFGEVSKEIASSGRQRLDRVWKVWRERGGSAHDEEFRRRLEAEVVPSLTAQERSVAEQVGEQTAVALEAAMQTLLTRVEELASAVTDLIHEVLPLAHEGLGLASRISGLSGKVRELGSGRVAIPEPLQRAAVETAGEYEMTVARLELEWATLGARAASVRAALRAAEETAFSEVTAEMADCVERLAAKHVEALNAAESKALSLVDELV
jgi:rRNA-processing protein FCF1